LQTYPDTRLIIVDTLAKVKPQTNGRRNLYETDYEALAGLQQLTTAKSIGVVVIHHQRKATSEDVFDTLNGSTGLSGCADAVLVLQRSRGGCDAELHVTGRDIEENTHALNFSGGIWSLAGGTAATLSASKRDILDALKAGPATPKAVAERLGRDRATVRWFLGKLLDTGLVHKTPEGIYSL
jgi:hypothetical protein